MAGSKKSSSKRLKAKLSPGPGPVTQNGNASVPPTDPFHDVLRSEAVRSSFTMPIETREEALRRAREGSVDVSDDSEYSTDDGDGGGSDGSDSGDSSSPPSLASSSSSSKPPSLASSPESTPPSSPRRGGGAHNSSTAGTAKAKPAANGNGTAAQTPKPTANGTTSKGSSVPVPGPGKAHAHPSKDPSNTQNPPNNIKDADAKKDPPKPGPSKLAPVRRIVSLVVDKIKTQLALEREKRVNAATAFVTATGPGGTGQVSKRKGKTGASAEKKNEQSASESSTFSLLHGALSKDSVLSDENTNKAFKVTPAVALSAGEQAALAKKVTDREVQSLLWSRVISEKEQRVKKEFWCAERARRVSSKIKEDFKLPHAATDRNSIGALVDLTTQMATSDIATLEFLLNEDEAGGEDRYCNSVRACCFDACMPNQSEGSTPDPSSPPDTHKTGDDPEDPEASQILCRELNPAVCGSFGTAAACVKGTCWGFPKSRHCLWTLFECTTRDACSSCQY